MTQTEQLKPKRRILIEVPTTDPSAPDTTPTAFALTDPRGSIRGGAIKWGIIGGLIGVAIGGGLGYGLGGGLGAVIGGVIGGAIGGVLGAIGGALKGAWDWLSDLLG